MLLLVFKRRVCQSLMVPNHLQFQCTAAGEKKKTIIKNSHNLLRSAVCVCVRSPTPLGEWTLNSVKIADVLTVKIGLPFFSLLPNGKEGRRNFWFVLCTPRSGCRRTTARLKSGKTVWTRIWEKTRWALQRTMTCKTEARTGRQICRFDD